MATEKSTEKLAAQKALETRNRLLELILEEIQRENLTAKHVAQNAGVAVSTVTRIKRGERIEEPGLLTILQIIYALEIPVDRILKKLL